MALKLKADPTFWAKVEITFAGGGSETIEVEFKHMNKTRFEAWRAEKEDSRDSSAILKIAQNWRGLEGDPPFTEENVEALISDYPKAGVFIAQTFISELLQVKLGN